MQPNQNVTSPTKSSHKRTVLIIIVIIILLNVGYFGIAPFIQKLTTTQQVMGKATQALEQKTRTYEKNHQQLLTDMKPITSEPSYSAVYNLCYEDHTDAGWTADHYNYKCQVVYYDIFAAKPGVSGTIYPPKNNGQDGRTINIRQLSNKDITRQTTRSLVTNDWVDNPLTRDIVTYAAYDAFGNQKRLKESGDPTFDTSKRYLMSTYTQQYYEKDVGCTIGRFLCESPLNHKEIYKNKQRS